MVLRWLFDVGGVNFRLVADRGRSLACGCRAGEALRAELGLGPENFGEVGFLGRRLGCGLGFGGVLGCAFGGEFLGVLLY